MAANHHQTIIDAIEENARELENLLTIYPEHAKQIEISILNVLDNVATKIETAFNRGNRRYLNEIMDKLRSFAAVSLHFSIITSNFLRLEDILKASSDSLSQPNRYGVARKLVSIRQNSEVISTDVQSLGTTVIAILNKPYYKGHWSIFDKKMAAVTDGLLKDNSKLIDVKNSLCDELDANWKPVFDIRPIITVFNEFDDKAGPFVRKFFCALGSITSIGVLTEGCVIAHAAYELYTMFISDAEPDLEHPHMKMFKEAIGHLKAAWETVKETFSEAGTS